MFNYICPACDHTVNSWHRMGNPTCPDCGTRMDRDFSRMNIQVATKTRDYILDTEQGPMRIQTLRQEDRVLKEKDLIRATADDCTGTRKFGRERKDMTTAAVEQRRSEWKEGIQKATSELKEKGYKMPTPKQMKRMKKGETPLVF